MTRWMQALMLTMCLVAQARGAVKPSETLQLAQARGALAVGVKADYPPFGFLDAQGRPQGLEVDLARDLARRLNVSLRLVPVTGANRLQKLEDGSVDVVIATMGDTADRRRLATAVEPNYYASGATLFMRPESRVRDWSELRGQVVCAVQGSYFNRPMAQRHLFELLMFNSARDARLAVRDGRCAGMLFDNTAIWADLQHPDWAGYKAPLPPVMNVAWTIALSRKEAGSELERIVGNAVADWHRSGFLAERTRAWGLPPSQFLAEAQALWSRRGAGGHLVCRRDPQGAWPAECRNRLFLTPQDVGGLHQFGLSLRDATGIDLSFVYDDFDRGRFLRGLATSVALMLACLAGSLALGVAGALLAESRFLLLGPLARALAAWGRMTPPLLQMYLAFFGAGAVAWQVWGVSLSAFGVATACLSYYTGAAVMAALLDACEHERGDQPGFRLRLRSLGRAYGLAAGSVTSSLVNVTKATMMSSAIAVPELMSAATAIVVDNGNVGEVMNALLLTFVLLVAGTLWSLQRLQLWLQRKGWRV